MSQQKCLTPAGTVASGCHDNQCGDASTGWAGAVGPQGEKLSRTGNHIFGGHRISLNGLELKIVSQLQDDVNNNGMSVRGS